MLIDTAKTELLNLCGLFDLRSTQRFPIRYSHGPFGRALPDPVLEMLLNAGKKLIMQTGTHDSREQLVEFLALQIADDVPPHPYWAELYGFATLSGPVVGFNSAKHKTKAAMLSVARH